MSHVPRPRVLTIAGSDSGGGAGIQADLKAICCLGGYGMSAVTALTAQNTVGVMGVFPVPAEFVALQVRACIEDIGVDAAKTGMLCNAEIVKAVAEALAGVPGLRLVVDPVMVAKSGHRLLAPDAERALVEHILPLALVVTPNLREAEALTGLRVGDAGGMRAAAEALRRMGPRHVIVKGGHLEGPEAVDVLYDGEEFSELRGPRLCVRHTHGTGCTFSAALATWVARGLEVREAAERAKRFITEAIRHGLALGRGQGPTDPLRASQECARADDDGPPHGGKPSG